LHIWLLLLLLLLLLLPAWLYPPQLIDQKQGGHACIAASHPSR